MPPKQRYPKTLAGRVAKFFHMKDAARETYLLEIVGGVTNYLVCVYNLALGPELQAGTCAGNSTEPLACGANDTTSGGYSYSQLHALPASYALCTGICTLALGLVANIPFVMGPAIPFAVAMLDASTSRPFPQILGANVVIGLLTLASGLASKKLKVIQRIMPEDYRLGASAGIGVLLALVAVRLMNIVEPGSTLYVVTAFSYKALLGIVTVVMILVMLGLTKRTWAAFSFILSILTTTVVSLIIRGSTGEMIIPPGSDALPDLSVLALPEMNWDANSGDEGFSIFRYVVLQYLNILFDLLATVVSLILLGVLSQYRSNYSKDVFLACLNESEQCFRLYVMDGLCNTLVAPFLCTAIVNPFIESAAGIVVGARTGLCAVVTGVLFLVSALFSSAIASIIPGEASGAGLLVSCFFAIRGLQHVDYDNSAQFGPALMAMALIPFTGSIGLGVSLSYIVLFAVYCLTPSWTHIRGQMVVCFAACVLLAILEMSTLISTNAVLGGVLGGFCAASLLGVCLVERSRAKNNVAEEDDATATARPSGSRQLSIFGRMGATTSSPQQLQQQQNTTNDDLATGPTTLKQRPIRHNSSSSEYAAAPVQLHKTPASAVGAKRMDLELDRGIVSPPHFPRQLLPPPLPPTPPTPPPQQQESAPSSRKTTNPKPRTAGPSKKRFDLLSSECSDIRTTEHLEEDANNNSNNEVVAGDGVVLAPPLPVNRGQDAIANHPSASPPTATTTTANTEHAVNIV